MGLGYARSLLSKCLIQDNQKKPSRANVYFCQDLFPLKKKKKVKKEVKEVRKNPRFSPEPSWSHGAWRAARQAGRKSGGLVMETCPVFHRKFIQTETLLHNILLTTNRHPLTKTWADGNLPAPVPDDIIVPYIIKKKKKREERNWVCHS